MKAKKRAVFSKDEKAAMREVVRERKGGGGDGAKDLAAKIAEMAEPDRAIAKRLDTAIRAATSLAPKTWYGMPAWADADGQVVCFFQSGAKFKARYATFGFSDKARVDDGALWPTSYAIANALSAADEAKLVALVVRAAQ